jgi:hypothetical protein
MFNKILMIIAAANVTSLVLIALCATNESLKDGAGLRVNGSNASTATPFDAGVFPVGEPAEVKFRLQNVSCGDLYLVNLTTGCGCLHGSLPTRRLRQNEEVIITLTMKPRDSVGEFAVTAMLRYQGPSETVPQQLALRATGRFVD